jgi:hypothetical protein
MQILAGFLRKPRRLLPHEKTELTMPLASWVAGGSKFHMLLED